MSLSRAVVWTDHQTAQVLQFDAEEVIAQAIRVHQHPTVQHHSRVRSEHEFFGDVCDALDGIEKVLMTGSTTTVADFQHFAGKHRPRTAARIVGYEVIDHLSENQLVALARKFFAAREQMAGMPMPR